jgi:uncharacterized membrane protein
MKDFIGSVAIGVGVGVPTAAAAQGPSLVPWPDRVRALFPAILGVSVGGGLAIGSQVQGLRGFKALAAGAGLAGIGTAGFLVAKNKLSELEAQNAQIDECFSRAPTDVYLSGSVHSAVDYSLLGREGARFINSVTTAAHAQALGVNRTHDPIRVFVSIANADSVSSRVSLAMSELIRNKAFDREYLLIQAPAGSGYSNSTPVDVVELLSGGDCASVSVSYGLLPSFLSLTRVRLAGETQLELLNAIDHELVGRRNKGKHVPKILLYGESLGARVQQFAIPLGSADLDKYSVHRALWVGTPGGRASDAFHRFCARESVTVDRPEQIPTDTDKRVWFLEHDGDPVVRFRPDLAWAQPAWLDPELPRGRNIPAEMVWNVGVTWATVLVDTIFATNVKPGDFQSLGHDYRADLGAVATAAFGFTGKLTAEQTKGLEVLLRQIEVARAQKLGEG